MSLSVVRAALKTRLETIAGLNVQDEPSESVPKFPTAVIEPESGDYQQALGGSSVMWTFRVTLMIMEGTADASYTALDGYLARTGAGSIPAAIKGGAVGDGRAFVRRVESIGFNVIRGQTLVTAQFVVDVIDSS